MITRKTVYVSVFMLSNYKWRISIHTGEWIRVWLTRVSKRPFILPTPKLGKSTDFSDKFRWSYSKKQKKKN